MFTEPYEIIDLGTYPDQAAYPPWGYHAKHVTHKEGAKAEINFFRRMRYFENHSRLANFTAFPIKIRGGSAGWLRPVAYVPRSHFPNGQTS